MFHKAPMFARDVMSARSHKPAKPSMSVSDDALSLVEGLWHETLHLAFRSTVTASILNAGLGRPRGLTDDDVTALRRHMPSELPITSVVASGLIEAPVPPRTLDVLADLLARTTIGTARMLAAAGHPADQQATREAALVWREICGLATALIHDLELAAPSLSTDLTLEAEPELLVVLRAARRGGTPCLDQNGRPFVPGWAQKRGHQRLPLRLTGSLEFDGQAWPIVVKDVSAGGLGVCGVPPVEVGGEATLRLETGERLHASVAWSVDGEAGLQLRTRLPRDHDLLQRARRKR